MTDSKPTSLEALAHLVRCIRSLTLFLRQAVRDWPASRTRDHASTVLADADRLADMADRWNRGELIPRPVEPLLAMASVGARLDVSIIVLTGRVDSIGSAGEDTAPKWHELGSAAHGIESWARGFIVKLAGADVGAEVAQLRRDLERAAREVDTYARSNTDLRQRLELRERWSREAEERMQSELARRDAIQEAERAAYVESVRALALQRYRDVIRDARATADSTEGPVKA